MFWKVAGLGTYTKAFVINARFADWVGRESDLEDVCRTCRLLAFSNGIERSSGKAECATQCVFDCDCVLNGVCTFAAIQRFRTIINLVEVTRYIQVPRMARRTFIM